MTTATALTPEELFEMVVHQDKVKGLRRLLDEHAAQRAELERLRAPALITHEEQEWARKECAIPANFQTRWMRIMVKLLDHNSSLGARLVESNTYLINKQSRIAELESALVVATNAVAEEVAKKLDGLVDQLVCTADERSVLTAWAALHPKHLERLARDEGIAVVDVAIAELDRRERLTNTPESGT